MTRFLTQIRQVTELLGLVKNNAIVALFILIFRGLTEGVGLLFIVPLLAIAGVSELESSNSQLVHLVQKLFEAMPFAISIESVLVVYFIIMCFYAMLNYTQGIVTVQINKQVVDRWRNLLFERITYASWSSIQSFKSSDLQALLTSDIKRFASVTNQTIQLVGALVLVTIYLILSLLLSVQLTIASLVPLGVLILLNRPLNKKTFLLGENTVKYNKAMQSSIVEHLGAIKLVKSYQKEREHLQKFKDNSLATEKQLLAFAKASGKTKLLFEVLAASVVVTYIFVALNLLHLPIAELFLLLIIFARLLPRVSKLASAYQQILNNLPSFEATKKAIGGLENDKALKGNGTLPKFERELQFEDVSFSYGEKEVLAEFTNSIPTYKTTVILGSSGAGKSTLIDLILGFQSPRSGKITVDGAQLNTLNHQNWRGIVALVPQDPFLFNESIKENISWSKPEATDQEIELALRQAGAYKFVQQLPKGIETVVGDRGMSLSGGERQRIALARALLRKPQLLILDEATNAVDDKNEELIAHALYELRGNMTIVIVAHRSKLVELADKVIKL